METGDLFDSFKKGIRFFCLLCMACLKRILFLLFYLFNWFAPVFSKPLFQQLQQFIPLERCCLNFISGEHFFRQLFFHLLQFDDLLLNCSFCNQFIHSYHIFLSNAVCAVGCLIFHGNIPPFWRAVLFLYFPAGQNNGCFLSADAQSGSQSSR